MATGQISSVVQHLRRSALLRPDGLSDGQLLECFVTQRDATALEALVRRHGAMVFGVCRRVLGNVHDAEDAFQAVFLVLVRKAASIWPRDMVGNWLYGVAYRTAMKARTTTARRRARERQMTELPSQAVCEEATYADLQPLLDGEVNRLAEKYRTAVVLCDLQGKSRREAARQLGWPEGTLSTRLTRARQILAKRLTRRGVALSAGTLALALGQETASASVPAPLLVNTIHAATLVAAGQAATAVVSAEVALLTQGVLRTMFMTKIKSAAIGLLLVAVLGTGAGVLIHPGLADQTPAAKATQVTEAIVPAAPSLDADDRPTDDFTVFAGGRDERRPTGVAGKVVAIAKDGKGLTLETAPQARGGEPTKHEVKLDDKTRIRFSGVGPDGAKLTVGYFAQVSTEDGKDAAVAVHLTGKENARKPPDLAGLVFSVAKDTVFLVQPRARGAKPEGTTIQLTPKTEILYSNIAKGGAKPTAGYHADVWLEPDSKDKAAKVHFTGNEPRPERGVEQPRPDITGQLVDVPENAQALTVLTSPRARGDEPAKHTYKIDDKTNIVYHNVGPNGDRPTNGYLAQVWVAENARDTAAKVVLQGVHKERQTVLAGRVVGVAKDGKSISVEMSATQRGEEPRKADIKITPKTAVIYQNVATGGARPTEGYLAQVRLEEGSQDTAAQLVLSPNEGRR